MTYCGIGTEKLIKEPRWLYFELDWFKIELCRIFLELLFRFVYCK